MALPVTIRGSFTARNEGYTPPFLSGGNVYVIVQDATGLQAFKATDPTSSFSEQDASNAPTGVSGQEELSVCQDGSKLHMVFTGTTNTGYYYARFDMSSDSWDDVGGTGVKRSTVEVLTATGAHQHSIVVVNSTVVIAYTGDTERIMGGDKWRVDYATRSATATSGTWSAGNALDAAGDIHYWNPIVTGSPNTSTTEHFMWLREIDTTDPPATSSHTETRSRLNGTLGSTTKLNSLATQTSSNIFGLKAVICVDNSGQDRMIVIGAENAGDDILTVTANSFSGDMGHASGSMDDVENAVTGGVDNGPGGADAQITMSQDPDSGDLYCIYARLDNFDLAYVVSDDQGQSFGTVNAIRSGTFIYPYSNIYTRSGSKKLAFVYVDDANDNFVYDEIDLGGDTTLTPTGVGSAEALGTPSFNIATFTITATGVASAEALGTPGVTESVTLDATGLASQEAYGTPTISSAITLTVTGLASQEAYGTPTIQPGAVTLTVTGLATAEAYGTPTISSIATLNVTGIASAEAYGTPTLTPGTVTLTVTGLASQEAYGTPTISSAITLTATGLASAEAYGTPTISQITLITATGLASAEAYGTPTVNPGTVTLTATGLASQEAYGEPTLQPGAVTLTATGLASQEAYGTPVLSSLEVLTATGIASAEAYGTPTLSSAITITATGLATQDAYGTPTIATGGILDATGVASAEAIGTPTIASAITLTVTGLVSAEAYGTPTVNPGAVTLTATGLVTAEAYGTPVLAGTVTLTVTGMASAEAYGTPSFVADTVLTVTGLASQEAYGVATISEPGGAVLIVYTDLSLSIGISL